MHFICRKITPRKFHFKAIKRKLRKDLKYLRGDEKGNKTGNSCETEVQRVAGGSTSVAWWWSIGSSRVGSWARRRNWNVCWSVDWSWGVYCSWGAVDNWGGSWAVSASDGGSIAVRTGSADSGVVCVGVSWNSIRTWSNIGWDSIWGLAAGGGVGWWGVVWNGRRVSTIWNSRGVWSWGTIWSWGWVSIGFLSAGADGVDSRAVDLGWAVGNVSLARGDGHVVVAGIGDLSAGAVVNWLGGWGSIDVGGAGVNVTVWLGSWGGVWSLVWGLLGAGAHGGVDSTLGGVVGGGLIVDVGGEGRADESSSSDEMHF